jgi:threonine dehydratase
MLTLADLEDAHALVREALTPTPAIAWPLLAQRLGAEAIVKHENHNPTGAFKVRGGLTYLDALKRRSPHTRTFVSATRGNHGQSLAFAARRAGIEPIVFVPHGNSVEKNAAMRGLGARLVEHGSDFQAAKEEAARYAEAEGIEMVPSFHRDLVRGVATYSLELLRAHPDLDAIYVPIGLGSGISGAIAARDALGSRCEIVGVQAEGAPAYALSFAAGRQIATNAADTRADGVATRVTDPQALDIILRGAARIVLVSDAEIAEAVRAYWTDTHNLAEGAGAAPLAAAIKERARLQGKRVGLVLSGGNIDFELFQTWIAQGPRA